MQENKISSQKIIRITIFLVISSFVFIILLFSLDIYNSSLNLKKELQNTNLNAQNALKKREEILKVKLEFLSKIIQNSNDIELKFIQFLDLNKEFSSLILVRKNGENLAINTVNKPKEFGFEFSEQIYLKDGFYQSDFFYDSGELIKFYALNVDENSYILAYENLDDLKY